MILFDKSKHFSHSTTPSTEPKSPNNEGFSADSAHAQLGGPKGLMCSHASRYSSYSYHLNFKRKKVKTFRIFFWQFKKWQKKKKFIFHNLLIKKQKCLTGSRSPLQFAPPSTLRWHSVSRCTKAVPQREALIIICTFSGVSFRPVQASLAFWHILTKSSSASPKVCK